MGNKHKRLGYTVNLTGETLVLRLGLVRLNANSTLRHRHILSRILFLKARKPKNYKQIGKNTISFPKYCHSSHNNTTQHNTTQHNTTQHNTNQTKPNKTQHITAQHSTTHTTQHSTAQHITAQHNT